MTWRKFFVLSALWNFTAAIPGIMFPSFSLRFFYGIETTDFHLLLLTSLFWGAVLIFGIGYLIVANDPEKNTGIVVLGVAGKIVMAIVWYCLYFLCSDRSTIAVVFAATGDLVFSSCFVYHLVRKRSNTLVGSSYNINRQDDSSLKGEP